MEVKVEFERLDSMLSFAMAQTTEILSLLKNGANKLHLKNLINQTYNNLNEIIDIYSIVAPKVRKEILKYEQKMAIKLSDAIKLRNELSIYYTYEFVK